MKMKLGNMKFCFLLVFGLLVTAFVTAEGGQQQAPAPTGPSSLVGVAYSTNDGSIKVHFINWDKIDMYFQGEKLERTYNYNSSTGTGKIIIGRLSAAIYDFTINNGPPEELVLTANINAVQQVMAVEPESFLAMELELLSEGNIRLQRKQE
ncbi:hypothetical protein AGMMS50268_29610 [Spirochaetia bacterium]|nr:hypothetical protein AGMMS50268_29610 [Spirochaetia bacterium]